MFHEVSAHNVFVLFLARLRSPPEELLDDEPESLLDGSEDGSLEI